MARKVHQLPALVNDLTGAFVGFIGRDGIEYKVPVIDATGALVDKTTGLFVGASAHPYAAPKKAIAASMRELGAIGNTTTTVFTPFLTRRAPDHFDAIQVVINGLANNSTDQIKMSVAVSDTYGNGYVPTIAGVAQVPIPITFGTTQRHNYRNPNGGAAFSYQTGASGSLATFDQVESENVSDIIQISSPARLDFPSSPPLVHIRMSGINLPIVSVAESNPSNGNNWQQVLPEYLNGYFNGEQTTAAAPGAPAAQGLSPSITVVFYLRGKAIYVVGDAGDSIEQGWIAATAVPQTGGLINGWQRQFVNNMIAAGIPATHWGMSYQGNRCRLFQERLLTAIYSGSLTHAWIKPWSINDQSVGLPSVAPALARCDSIIQACLDMGVVPMIVQPFGTQMLNAQIKAIIVDWVARCKAAGFPVFDARPTTDNPDGTMKVIYRTVNSGGTEVDSLHPNAQGHFDIGVQCFNDMRYLFP